MKYKFYGLLYDLIHFILPNLNNVMNQNDILYTSQQYKNIINLYDNTIKIELGFDGEDILCLCGGLENYVIEHQIITKSTEKTEDDIPYVLLDDIDLKKIGEYVSFEIKYFNVLDYVSNISLLQKCEAFITSNQTHKDFALNTLCKKIILLVDDQIDTMNYYYNPFDIDLVITDTLTPLKFAFCFYPESIKSILYDNYKKCPYDKMLNVVTKSNLITEINKLISKNNYLVNKYLVIINTNFSHCENYYGDLINKFSKTIPSNFNACYLYKDDTIHNSILIIKPQTDISKIISNIYQLTLNSVSYCNKALLLNGIGDFIMLDYHYDLTKYKYIYVITNNSEATVHTIKNIDTFKNDYIIEYDTQKAYNISNFLSYERLMNSNLISPELKQELQCADSYSVFNIFPKMSLVSKHDLQYRLKYNCRCDNHRIDCYSNILNTKFNIKSRELPPKYIIIAPYTTNLPFGCYVCGIGHQTICPKTKNGRQFNDLDWENTLHLLNDIFSLPGVVLGTTKVQEKFLTKNIIDLTNKTSIIESFEIVKNAYGYIGIDTCFAVLSTKCLKYNIIKSVNKFEWIGQYYNNNINNTIYLYDNIPKIHALI